MIITTSSSELGFKNPSVPKSIQQHQGLMDIELYDGQSILIGFVNFASIFIDGIECQVIPKVSEYGAHMIIPEGINAKNHKIPDGLGAVEIFNGE